MTTVLHEILAIESDRDAASNAALTNTQAMFQNGQHLFLGQHAVYEPFDSESLEGKEDVQDMTTTVPEVLAKLSEPFARALDVTATKDVTNQSEAARSAVEVDGKEIIPPFLPRPYSHLKAA